VGDLGRGSVGVEGSIDEEVVGHGVDRSGLQRMLEKSKRGPDIPSAAKAGLNLYPDGATEFAPFQDKDCFGGSVASGLRAK
jgi:hypothetical protein